MDDVCERDRAQLMSVGQEVPPLTESRWVVGACGICCNVCRLYLIGACAGCAPEEERTPSAVAELACPILACASAKGMGYCLRDCPEYPCSLFEHGLPVCARLEEAQPLSKVEQMPSAWAKLEQRITEQPMAWQPGAREPALYIFCLGPLRVYLDGRKIDDASWGQAKGPSQKVKTLFAYLAARDECGATKDEILELLWPGEPPGKKLNTRFHTVLFYLRKALEPDMKSRAESRYVVYRYGRYMLDPPEGCWTDVATFEACVQRASSLERQGKGDIAIRYWKLAESLYQGDYLAGLDQRYMQGYLEDWYQVERFRLKDMAVGALVKLTRYHFQRGEDRLCRGYARRALAMDPGCEEAHRLLMRLCHRAGRRGDLIRQYRLCRQYLLQAEDRGPEPETESLYRQLLFGSTSHLSSH